MGSARRKFTHLVWLLVSICGESKCSSSLLQRSWFDTIVHMVCLAPIKSHCCTFVVTRTHPSYSHLRHLRTKPKSKDREGTSTACHCYTRPRSFPNPLKDCKRLPAITSSFKITSLADPRGGPLAPKIFSKSYSFQAILRGNPLFWVNFGLRAPLPLGSKLCWAPLTKILDPRL